MAITAVSANRAPATPATGVSHSDAVPDSGPHSEQLSRCRMITVAEPRCEAVWDEKRRRFFRREEHRP
ncbi:putative entry exclusion protein TrbK-alt [Blastomonas aquatica]|nr:putative entry exclusion protein TrbK-alt [Blastomonas aquatica]